MASEAIAPTSNLAPEPSDSMLRLNPLLTANSIPYHPVLSSIQTEKQCPNLQSFTRALLTQGQTFATTTLNSFNTQKGTKTSEGSTAPVSVLKGTVGDEYWVARRSTHGGKAEPGDATWDEFDSGIRIDHSKNEMAYTPGVQDSVEICDWKVDGLQDWTNVKLTVIEMQHRLPSPLKPRVFTVILLSAISTDSKSFLVVSAPLVQLRHVTASKYANGATANTVVHAAYSSVEHVYMNEDGTITWDMGTVSDAKGALPISVQKLGIVGAIVKDVGLFLKWVAGNRLK